MRLIELTENRDILYHGTSSATIATIIKQNSLMTASTHGDEFGNGLSMTYNLQVAKDFAYARSLDAADVGAEYPNDDEMLPYYLEATIPTDGAVIVFSRSNLIGRFKKRLVPVQSMGDVPYSRSGFAEKDEEEERLKPIGNREWIRNINPHIMQIIPSNLVKFNKWLSELEKSPIYKKTAAFIRSKIRSPVLEAPIGDISFHGPTEPASMRADDIGIVNSEKGCVKIKRVLNKAPVLINLVFVNHPYKYDDDDFGNPERLIIKHDRLRATASGEMDADEFHHLYGIDLPASPDALTVAFGFNEGGERMPLTPWMIAHRIGHALHEKDQQKAGGRGQFTPAITAINDIFTAIPWDAANIMGINLGDVVSIIGTWKSARDGNIFRPNEFIVEAFAQYMIEGKIRLNPLPAKFPFKRNGSFPYVEFENLAELEIINSKLQWWATSAAQLFGKVLRDSVGQIVVM